MKFPPVPTEALAALGATLSLWCLLISKPTPASWVSQKPAAATAVSLDGTGCLTHLPTAFVPNLGQWRHAARYVARRGATTMFLEPDGLTLTLTERAPFRDKAGLEDCTDTTPVRGIAVRMTLLGASAKELSGESQLPGRHHYFLGNDPAKWRTNVPLYGAVRYSQALPGIDMRVREQEGHFEYDLMLQPEALLEAVEIAIAGTDRLHLDVEGALVMQTQLGAIRMPPPVSWEEAPSGERSSICCRYELRGENRFGFAVAGRRPGSALVIDPGLIWSTYVGGSDFDRVYSLALDAQAAVTVAGMTPSVDFPTTLGAFATTYNSYYDGFVSKLSKTGSNLVYSTFLGGSWADEAYGVALDAQGSAIVAGVTGSSDFPTTPGAFNTTPSIIGSNRGFVTKLSPMGSSLVYSTFLSGGIDAALALVVDGQGSAIVGGRTNSPTFPTTPGAFDTTHNGNYDGFVTKLSPTGSSLAYSTFLGGSWGPAAGVFTGGDDWVNAVALDGQGRITVTGLTCSADFPITPGAFDTNLNSFVDAFVTRFTPTGSALAYSTYIGGTETSLQTGEKALALAVDAQGLATVAGMTTATDFPTTPGAFDTTFNGGSNGFVTRLTPTGSALLYSTLLGGSTTWVNALAVDPSGAATVAGLTYGNTFPTTPGAFNTVPTGNDAFVTRLSPTGSRLLYSTYLSPTSPNSAAALALALDAQGAATVAGYAGPGFPTTPGAFSTVHTGNGDGFVIRLDMLPTGASVFGSASPGCTGPLAIGVTSMPQIGNAAFAITCGNAAPTTAGLIAFAGAGLPSEITVLGVDVWIDPTSLLTTATVFSNPIGAGEVPLPIPAASALVGLRLFAQFVWIGPGSPPPCPPLGLSASNALGFTIQP
jgi:hypothetical protein